MLAAKNGHVDCLRELITSGAEVNIQSINGKTALIHTSEKGHTDGLKLLLEAGANLDIADSNGNTVLLAAAKSSNEQIIQLLIDWGADVNAENDHGETALYLAVTKSHTEFEREEINEEYEGSSLTVYKLLLAGAQLHETKSGLNPCISTYTLWQI